MSTYEQKGVLTYKDKDGNIHKLYPRTHRDSLSGMEYIDLHIDSLSNPHNVTPKLIGAIPNTSIATLSEVKELLGISEAVESSEEV